MSDKSFINRETKIIAILAAIFYSNREDVQMSKSEAVIQARNIFINPTIIDLNQNQVDTEDRNLLELFFEELKLTGRCDYPAFVDYVKYAREVEKTRLLQEDLEVIETAKKLVKNGYKKLKNSSTDSEIAAARNLIHQGCDSIKALTFRYFEKDSHADELIKTVEYVQAYLQYAPLDLLLATRPLGYLDEVLTAIISLGDRLDKTIHKHYNFTLENS